MLRKLGMASNERSVHWADFAADKIIREKGDKKSYVVASGITPSGVVHFGNFREVITVDFVARALRKRGKEVRFIFSWDDYDTFRKVPSNMPKQDELAEYLFQPIVDTPDPTDKYQSYASLHEHNFESQLAKVGVAVEPIYQAKKYRSGEYRDGIRTTLLKADEIKEILNQHRKVNLADSWLPVSIYCESCNTDNKIINLKLTNDLLAYECENCDHVGCLNLTTTERVKLPWRMDWPMRWAFEKVDFEPGGKDHSSQGGSFTTAKEIVKLYDWTAPVYLQYDFVSIKGAGGKMSSSSGDLITVNDILKVYEPEMVRWIFASYKSNVDFSVSFDLDVIKLYEDYDRQERLAYEIEPGNEKKVAMAKRVFELSNLTEIAEVPAEIPIQPSFRHLCNILQIHNGEIQNARDVYQDQIKNERDERRFSERSACALHWLKNYAPEDFKFSINEISPKVILDDNQRLYLKKLFKIVTEEFETFSTDKMLHSRLYQVINELEMKPNDIFPVLYNILISKEKGPKMAGFMRTIGKIKILGLLEAYN
jgi:lysyl-tRNA synthetase, class I